MNGTANSSRTSNVGMTTVPIHSHEPLNAFSASYRKRKFHSGFGRVGVVQRIGRPGNRRADERGQTNQPQQDQSDHQQILERLVRPERTGLFRLLGLPRPHTAELPESHEMRGNKEDGQGRQDRHVDNKRPGQGHLPHRSPRRA